MPNFIIQLKKIFQCLISMFSVNLLRLTFNQIITDILREFITAVPSFHKEIPLLQNKIPTYSNYVNNTNVNQRKRLVPQMS